MPTSTNSSPPRHLVLFAIILAFLPIVLDMTILHVAIPSLTLGLKATGEQVLWVLDIYPLLMAGLMVSMGSLADRLGPRRLILTGLAIFLIGSTASAFAPSAWALVASRAVMGVGAAMVLPCTLAMIRYHYESQKDLAMAYGIWSAVSAGGAALGPLVGGALLAHFWWGSVFLVNLPVLALAIPVLAYCTRGLPPPAAVSGRWKVEEAAMLTAGLMLTIFAIKSFAKGGVLLGSGGGLLVLGVLLVTWFVRRQLAATRPMFDVGLLTKPAIAAGIVMALGVTGALAGFEMLLAQELQFVMGRTPLQAGMFMLPLIIAAAVGGPLSGRVIGKLGLRTVSTMSMAIAALSLCLLATSNFASDTYRVSFLMAMLGLALGIGTTASSVAVMNSAPKERAGAAGSLEATSYDLGSGLGITLFGLLVTTVYQAHLQVPPELSTPELAAMTMRTIGETFIAADTLSQGAELLRDAGRQAFSSAHSRVLFTASALFAVLAPLVFWMLRRYKPEAERT